MLSLVFGLSRLIMLFWWCVLLLICMCCVLVRFGSVIVSVVKLLMISSVLKLSVWCVVLIEKF